MAQLPTSSNREWSQWYCGLSSKPDVALPFFVWPAHISLERNLKLPTAEVQVITHGSHRATVVTHPYFTLWSRFQVNGDMVIVSKYMEIAAGSAIVPIRLEDNGKCPFCASNHFLLLVDILPFWIIQHYGCTAFAKEEAHCSTITVNAFSSG